MSVGQQLMSVGQQLMAVGLHGQPPTHRPLLKIFFGGVGGSEKRVSEPKRPVLRTHTPQLPLTASPGADSPAPQFSSGSATDQLREDVKAAKAKVKELTEDVKAAKAKVKELTEENNCHCEQIVKLQNALVDARAGKSKAPAKEAAAATGLPDGLNKKLAAKAEQDGAAKSKELKKMNEEYGNKYFAAGITAAEGNPKALERSMIGANNTTHAHNTAALGKVFASEGPESLALCIYVPEASEVQAKEWPDAAMEGIGGMAVATDVHETGSMISLKVQQNTEAGRFPIKDKDEVIHHAFTYIRSKGLLNETDDDDEPDISALGEYASKPGHLTGTKLRPSSQD